MSKIKLNTKIAFTLTLELNEEEARALEATAGYGTNAFLKVFYEHLGEAYLKPHENGIRTLFEKISNTVPFFTKKIDSARRSFEL